MEKKFLMGSNDWLVRSRSVGDHSTSVSSRLRKNLIIAAMHICFDFYSTFFDISIEDIDIGKLSVQYEKDYLQAVSLGLFQVGGIGEKDHLNLWCLGRIFSPDIYVESGVFTGSSLHAFINAPKINRVFVIDPNLSNLKIPEKDISGAELIDNADFSQMEFDLSGKRSLVYFDDHIDTAARILQAFEKGFRYLLFDDSTGFEGICQRLYPAIPTIPMIMNAELLSAGDALSWTFSRQPDAGIKGIVKNIIQRKINGPGTRVDLSITQELIQKCCEAKTKIRNCKLIPDLGGFIPQQNPAPMIDTGKYIVELHQSRP